MTFQSLAVITTVIPVIKIQSFTFLKLSSKLDSKLFSSLLSSTIARVRPCCLDKDGEVESGLRVLHLPPLPGL